VFKVLGLVEDLVHYLIRPAGVRTSRAREEIHEVAIAYGNYNPDVTIASAYYSYCYEMLLASRRQKQHFRF